MTTCSVVLGLLVPCRLLSAAAPDSLNLDAQPLSENLSPGANIGTLSASAPDPLETFHFELVAGEGDTHNPGLVIRNRTLVLTSSPDFETLGGNLTIRVRVTSSTSESLERICFLTLTDDREEDADGDGISEADEEDLYGSSDTSLDSDGDGFGDAYEIANDYLPADAGSLPAGARVIGWGDDSSGQSSVPGDLGDVIEIAAGASHSLALRSDGTVAAWGNNDDGQCDVPADLAGVVSIGAGDRHSLAVLANGQVVGWGANEFGQATPPENLADVVAVAGGGHHTLALRRDGRITVWGADDFLQSTPPGASDVVSISATRDQCMMVFSDGKVRTWGRNDSGQSLQPEILNPAIMGASGENHSLMLRRDGFIAGWGIGAEGQLESPAHVQDAIAISSRGLHNLAIRGDGSVVAWGSNTFGQTNTPYEARRAKMVAAGARHSLVLRSNGNFPQIASPASVTGTVGENFSHQLAVANATAVSYSSMVLPDGLSLDPVDRTDLGHPAQ